MEGLQLKCDMKGERRREGQGEGEQRKRREEKKAKRSGADGVEGWQRANLIYLTGQNTTKDQLKTTWNKQQQKQKGSLVSPRKVCSSLVTQRKIKNERQKVQHAQSEGCKKLEEKQLRLVLRQINLTLQSRIYLKGGVLNKDLLLLDSKD